MEAGAIAVDDRGARCGQPAGQDPTIHRRGLLTKGETVRCPYCEVDRDRVIDSRAAEEGQAIRRRRACLTCGQRFSTYERVEQVPLQVRKRSGDTEPFDRDKVATGIVRATKNLALEPGAVRRAVARVEGRMRDKHRRVVDSEDVGAAVLDALSDLHEVAYLRFASVYKSFTTPDDFHRELARLDRGEVRDGSGAASDQAAGATAGSVASDPAQPTGA